MIAALQRLPVALPAAVWAAILFLIVLAIAVIAPQWLAHSDPLLADPVNAQLPPSAQHWLGTDQLGRDLLTRVIYGSRYSLLISVAAMALAVVFGTLLGLVAALARGVVDELLSRAVDVISAFPDLLLALMLIAFTGPGTNNLIIALGVASVPRFARVVRAQTYSVMTSGYVEQARTFGLSRFTLITRHILPHAIAQVPALATLGLGTAIIGTAGLSFLGMGPQPPTAEWGLMLAEGRNYLRNAWWIAVWPGVFITLTVIAVNTLGRYWQARFEGRSA
ncbi:MULTISPECIES: ABC transporter permease [Pantoea]|jgi:peptide/nickel transport system permease protein|uniref:ABC transporter permease n=1 Tax=Pantoea trifolii TaxID=2968030 RepID=A0ABT1VRY6_9GAMM|nr:MULTISPECIES: ABC transporter permease [Pantoea]MRS17679.1 ABC transporter permease subunit [Enterobacteriaceae bacterium RIT692]MBY4888663.1 ABC transporter permease [Pantoea sp. DY-15]MCQ8230309.1 ABC transporter permease [Pantoea sp. MMK2]MCQ8239023.1 ABC transporter permease [Pantoea sp. MMK3]MCW6033600.1 ABC transporter permease [Pantoea sp. JK]